MSNYCSLSAQFAGWMSGALAVLALLTMPSSVQADQLSDCQAMCSGYTDQAYSQCVGDCMAGSEYSHCPNPARDSCYLNNGNKLGCPGTACPRQDSKGICGCVYDGDKNKCNCPP